MIEQSRRGFITGLISLVAAPAIVRAGSLMPIKGDPLTGWREIFRSAPTIETSEIVGYTYTIKGWDVMGEFVSEQIEWMPRTVTEKLISIA